MARNKRVKTKALGPVPQNLMECANQIRVIGDHQRERDRLQAEMGDKIAHIQDQYAGLVAPINRRIEEMTAGVQAYAEANRAELTNNGKRKSADLVTGELGWRTTPPSIVCRGVAAIIEAIKRKRLGKQYLRPKVELNKDAITLEKIDGEWVLPEKLRGIPGLSVKVTEEFFVKPAEADLEEVA